METTKTFMLFGKSGTMEEIKPVPVLPLYCKVYLYGFAMSSSLGAVISPPDANGTYKVVKMSDYEQGFNTLDKYSRPHSALFGIGIYYDDNFECWPEAEVLKYIELGKLADQKRKEEADAKHNADEAEKKALPSLYPHLIVNTQDDQKTTKLNLVAELKKNFPGFKFSVTKEHYDCYNVRWTNGPTTNQVTDITNKFENSENDWSGDFRDYAPSNFNRVFGGYKYVFENRDISPDIYALAPSLASLLGDYCKNGNYEDKADNILYRIMNRTLIPVNAKNFRIERNETTGGQIEDLYNICFDVEESKPVPAPLTAPITGIEIIDYSAKAVAVIGDTKPIKDTLKEMGGRFNFRLSCGPGWIFPATKKDLLLKLLK